MEYWTVGKSYRLLLEQAAIRLPQPTGVDDEEVSVFEAPSSWMWGTGEGVEPWTGLGDWFYRVPRILEVDDTFWVLVEPKGKPPCLYQMTVIEVIEDPPTYVVSPTREQPLDIEREELTVASEEGDDLSDFQDLELTTPKGDKFTATYNPKTGELAVPLKGSRKISTE